MTADVGFVVISPGFGAWSLIPKPKLWENPVSKVSLRGLVIFTLNSSVLYYRSIDCLIGTDPRALCILSTPNHWSHTQAPLLIFLLELRNIEFHNRQICITLKTMHSTHWESRKGPVDVLAWGYLSNENLLRLEHVNFLYCLAFRDKSPGIAKYEVLS